MPKLGEGFLRSPFRQRFESKGRLRDFVEKIPTYVIMRPLPALIGVAQLLKPEQADTPQVPG